MKRLSAFLIAACLLLPGTAAFAQTKIYPAPTRFSATIAPATNDGAALGTTDLGWSDVHLATGGVINWANGETTITGAADTLTLAGGNLLISNLTDTRIVYVGASGLLTNSANFTFDGTNLFLGSASSKISMGPSDEIILFDEAANILQLGPDAAAPAAQIFKGPDGSGANVAGGKFTSAGGRGTGTGAGGSNCIATAPAGGAGSTQNALVDQICVDSTGAVTATGLAAASGEVTICATTTGLLVKRSAACVGTP